MWMPASEDMASLLSAWDFSLRDSWDEDEEQEGFSGMKRATRKATTTVHAPNRKGGPGMRARYVKNRETNVFFNYPVFHLRKD